MFLVTTRPQNCPDEPALDDRPPRRRNIRSEYVWRGPLWLNLRGVDQEIETEIEFVYHPEVKPTPPSYWSGGEPGESAMCEIMAVRWKLDGKTWTDAPPWALTILDEDDDMQETLLWEARP